MNDDIVRQEMAYNRERKHTMKKRAKKLRLRMTQRYVQSHRKIDHRLHFLVRQHTKLKILSVPT